MILTTDGSLQGLGACLAQVQNNQEITISYWSETLNAAQRNYCLTHIELLAVVEGIEAHHHYLAGAPFILRTDHAALVWLRSFKNLRGRLARWIEQLEFYKFTVQHVPASSIPHVDALSRMPNRPCDPTCTHCTRIEQREKLLTASNINISWTRVTPSGGVSPEQMAIDQRCDEDLKSIVTSLLQGQPRPLFQDISQYGPVTRTLWHQYQSLVVVNNIMFRRYENTSGKPEFSFLQLILPQVHIKPTVQFYHSNISCGQHVRREKTLALIKRYFYWPCMSDSVTEIINSCETCFKAKGPTHRTKYPLKLFKDGILHGRWHNDFCGPFVPTNEGFRFILVAVESMSCWPVTLPTKTQSSQEVAQNLIDVFSVYGSPLSIKTDQGRQLEANLLRDIMTLWN